MQSEIEFRVRTENGKTHIGYEFLSPSGWRKSLNNFRCKYDADAYGIFDKGLGLIREQFSTFTDITGNKIYAGDKLRVGEMGNKGAEYEGMVVFDAGCFSLKITKTNQTTYDVGGTPPLYNFNHYRIVHSVEKTG